LFIREEIAGRAGEADCVRLAGGAPYGAGRTFLQPVVVVPRERHTSVSSIVHHSEVIADAVDALAVEVAVVAVVGTHLATEGRIVHHRSRLADAQAGTHHA
jgi:hypothetical protein